MVERGRISKGDKMNTDERNEEILKALDTLRRVIVDTDAKAHLKPSVQVLGDIQRNIDIMASSVKILALFQATAAVEGE